ncbi:MAG: hypothetical protein ACLFSB_15815, partial [Chitinispirillaceae bacterium]
MRSLRSPQSRDDNGYCYEGTTNGIAKALAGKEDWLSSETAGTPGNNVNENNKSGFSGLPAETRGAFMQDLEKMPSGGVPMDLRFI